MEQYLHTTLKLNCSFLQEEKLDVVAVWSMAYTYLQKDIIIMETLQRDTDIPVSIRQAIIFLRMEKE